MPQAARIVALFAGALATALLPWAPAPASADTCRMPGCASSSLAKVGPADCCCGVSNAPAVAGGPATVAGPSGKIAPLTAALDTDPLSSAALAALGVANEPPAHVPLFLLNATLLI